jgi:hypothetical protein
VLLYSLPQGCLVSFIKHQKPTLETLPLQVLRSAIKSVTSPAVSIGRAITALF